jgi:hypothetical protein
MRVIELNAEKWTNRDDFYQALLAALRSPEGHGDGMNAMIDSMIWGGMNRVEPPYTVRIVQTSGLLSDVRDEIADLQRAIAKGRKDSREWRGMT